MAPKFVDHFGKVSSKYLTFRPTYPNELFDIIRDYTQSDTTRQLAFDIGCGNGQATVKLADMYEKVIGFDPSEGQITSAQPHPRVEYRVSPAEKIDWHPDGSVDLITVAQAVHWFDLPTFYNETKRLLKPKTGSLIIWGYGTCSIVNNDKAQQIHRHVCDEYWPSNRKFVDREYVDIIPTYSNTIRKNTSFNKKLSIGDMIGYYSTWSGYNQYLKTNECKLPSLKEQLLNAYNTTDENTEIELSFPLFIILSKKD
ncbi:putative SAM dependent methyltransferase [Cavenderia fasciculata]|uniref:SAM dependent methyltransferase n=1 Tax=Cavenderia fasciculata TaxID=261658 RepID=F4Q1Q0_CACFS|nr:putative SAM dependent methyltransferase [Cavenderia fasciculata]EGG18200.1 putative SAM dependent methyltransferase [Cavenderia fasciculata]|eukprot:XP_004357023.1 putative SAM dependent methyltransferase [Cavenderia fasciculata]